MKAIWMHGMGGSPSQEKMQLMEQYGLSTSALHLDYNREPQRFEILRDYCLTNSIELLVGSSFGGFMGFWLSEELGLPCILLNPAVSLSNKNKTKPSGVSHLKSTLCLVALGAKDEQVDPQRTLLFMEKDKREGKTIFTKVFENEGHGLSIEAFREVLEWALPYIENWREKQ
jgi:hypothetical protein